MILDISNRNTNLNLKKAIENSDEIEGVFLKASEGVGFTDQTFTNRIDIIHNKSDLICGIYHFFRPDLNNKGTDEAIFFFNTIKNHIKNSDILICDAELGDGDIMSHQLPKFYNKLHQLAPNNKILIYGMNSRYSAYEFEKYPATWIAGYGSNSGMVESGYQPHHSNMVLWQYTSKYKLKGYDYDLDASVIIKKDYFTKGENMKHYKVDKIPKNQYGKAVYFAYENTTDEIKYTKIEDLGKMYRYYVGGFWKHTVIHQTNLYEDKYLKNPYKNSKGDIIKLNVGDIVMGEFSGEIDK